MRKVKLSEEVGVRYMQAWEEKYYEREEGREEGEILNRISLIQKKIIKGKTLENIADDLEMTVKEISEIYEVIKENPENSREEIFDIWRQKESFPD